MGTVLVPMLLTLLVVIGALYLGTVRIPVGDIIAVLRGAKGAESTAAVIILKLRLPRLTLAFIVGASLALAGCILQGLLRNPLADPYIIGASAGASVGAAVALTITGSLGLQFAESVLGLGLLPPFAFVGAVTTVAVVYQVARVRDRVPVVTLLLAGIAFSTVLNAVLSLLIYFSDAIVQPLIYWLMGSLGSRGWKHVLTVLPYPVLGAVYVAVKSEVLDAFAMGEEKAQQLGVEVEQEKRRLLALAALLTAAAVAVSGVIGFVGLLIPHVVRLIYGPSHRQLMWRSLLWGGNFMILADTAARTLLSPTEIPVGIITALCGGPYFIYLLKQQQGKYWGGMQ